MKPLRFCLALHLHQPWGNFDSVFEQHLQDVYRPLLRTMMAGELWPVAMHLSGPLLEWLDTRAPDFVDEVGEHVTAGRIELLCAGHDEPILAVLSRQDRWEQIHRHREWIRSRFGVDARGVWLTERVWEPNLPGELAAAGARFVLVDDRHFRVSGFSADELHAHFITEAGGHRLSVFPIAEQLRYLIPFRPPEELAAYFRSLRAAGHQLAILGDDGEKFGGWPGTRKWLYEDGWFESFLGTLRELRDNDEVRLSRFDDALASTPSGGLAYLPSASYREMEGWSLPYEPARALLRLEQEWDGARIQGVEAGLLRGSHWRHFLVKYPESNRMHKVAMALSKTCRERGDPVAARRAIGRAQCNDAYWHGVFGGLYLPFLRAAIWSNLATAEALLRAGQPASADLTDIDADGNDEIWIRSPEQSIIIAPSRGGMTEMWLDLAGRENVLNVVARHREAYHEALNDGGTESGGHAAAIPGGAPSIHDLETQLTEAPAIDTEPRGLFVDRVLGKHTSIDVFAGGTASPIKTWARDGMSAKVDASAKRVEIRLQGEALEKTIVIAPRSITCTWQWDRNRFPADAWFSSEMSFSGSLEFEAAGSERWDYPIETVAKSEKGFDRTIQGTAAVFRWPVTSGTATIVARLGDPA